VSVTFWLEAYFLEAYACTAIMVVGAVMQYHYCLRIYNRFKFDGMFVDHWEKNETERKVGDDSDLTRGFAGSFSDTASEKARAQRRAGYGDDQAADDGSVDSRQSRNSAAKERGQERKGILKKLLSRAEGPHPAPAGEERRGHKALHAGKVYKQGYISLRNSQVSLLWTRYYFVLRGTNMWYYKDRAVFEKDATESMISRPIDLLHYTPCLISNVPPFRLGLNVNAVGLQAKVKDWEFTVDTKEELQEWMSVLTAAASAGQRSHQSQASSVAKHLHIK
jgi:hypothetical protein